MNPQELAREAFRSAFAVSVVPIEEARGVYLRKLSLAELQQDIFPLARTDGDITSALLARSVCDANGERIFGADDEEELARDYAGGPLVALAERAARLNGLDAKAREDVQKNSPTPTSGSPCG